MEKHISKANARQLLQEIHSQQGNSLGVWWRRRELSNSFIIQEKACHVMESCVPGWFCRQRSTRRQSWIRAPTSWRRARFGRQSLACLQRWGLYLPISGPLQRKQARNLAKMWLVKKLTNSTRKSEGLFMREMHTYQKYVVMRKNMSNNFLSLILLTEYNCQK